METLALNKKSENECDLYKKKCFYFILKKNVILRIITAITAAVTIIITAIYVHCLFTICNKFIV